jgi:hypothetical protein
MPDDNGGNGDNDNGTRTELARRYGTNGLSSRVNAVDRAVAVLQEQMRSIKEITQKLEAISLHVAQVATDLAPIKREFDQDAARGTELSTGIRLVIATAIGVILTSFATALILHAMHVKP